MAHRPGARRPGSAHPKARVATQPASPRRHSLLQAEYQARARSPRQEARRPARFLPPLFEQAALPTSAW